MATLEVNNKQLRLIQQALDLYSRIGIGQFGVIKDHPTFEKHIANTCRPTNIPIVGDSTPQGKVLEIKNSKALIDGSVKNGKWNKSTEWKKLKDVKLSTDYEKFHFKRDVIDGLLHEARNVLIQEPGHPRNGSWGIHNPKVDDTCREAFDIIQVIRHEFWKADEDRNDITVDSHVMLTTKDSDNIKVTL